MAADQWGITNGFRVDPPAEGGCSSKLPLPTQPCSLLAGVPPYAELLCLLLAHFTAERFRELLLPAWLQVIVDAHDAHTLGRLGHGRPLVGDQASRMLMELATRVAVVWPWLTSPVGP